MRRRRTATPPRCEPRSSWASSIRPRMSSMPRPRSGSPAGWPRPPASRTVTTTVVVLALEADVDGHGLEVVAVLDGVLPGLVGGHHDAGHLVGRGAHLDEPAAQHAPQRGQRVGVGREGQADGLAQRGLGAHEQRASRRRRRARGRRHASIDVVAHGIDVARRAGQRAQQARQAGVDALVAALDEAVGEERERGAGREVDDDLRRAGRSRRCRAPGRSPPAAAPTSRGRRSAGGGWPALTSRRRPRSGSMTA